MSNKKEATIATTLNPICNLCGSPGKFLYKNLRDRLFSISGSWHLKRCLDQDCGLAWLDPLPTKEDIGKTYKNYYTHDSFISPNIQTLQYYFLREIIRNFQDAYIKLRYGCSLGTSYPQNVIRLLSFVNAVKKRIASDLKTIEDLKLLELGCGSGELLVLLQSMGWKVQGIDTDPVAVARASDKGLEVHLGNLVDQKYPNEYFDIIVMNHVIEHIHDPVSLLTECHRVLQAGGQLVLITPNFTSWGHRIFKDSWIGLDPPRHLYLYSARTLKIVSDLAGFKVESLTTSAKNAEWFFLASRALLLNKENVLHPTASTLEKIMAKGFAILETMLVGLHFGLGEELVLEAEKIP